MMLLKWTKGLRVKLLLMGLVPVMVFAVMSYFTMSALSEFQDRLEKSYHVRAPLIEMGGNIDSGIHALGRWMWITYGLAGQVGPRDNFIKKSLTQIEEIERLIANYSKMPLASTLKERFAAVEKAWPLAKAGALDAIELFKAHNERDNEQAKQVMQQKLLPHLLPITKTMAEIETEMHQILESETKDVVSFSREKKSSILIIAALSGIVCLFFSISIGATLSGRLTRVSQRLHEASNQVHVAAGKIASSSEELSQATTEQAASLQETAASLEEITAMIGKSTESAQMTSDNSTASKSKAQEGQSSVNQMIESMDEISKSNEHIMNQINHSNQQMAEIVKVIQEIGEKTKVINDIVFQTKLLSFNASVEAARAGEHGKGFAVVAEEVGNLAQMSGNAAREISEMLSSSISKVEGIVRDTKTKVEVLIASGKERVDSGVVVARQCASVLGEIVENVARVADLALEISSASKEQSQGVSEINKAMAQMDTVTQQNATTSEDAARSAEELSHQADSLKLAVEELVQAIDGKHSTSMSLVNSSTKATAAGQSEAKNNVGNVIPFKARNQSGANGSAGHSASKYKQAASDDTVPSGDHADFRDF